MFWSEMPAGSQCCIKVERSDNEVNCKMLTLALKLQFTEAQTVRQYETPQRKEAAK